MKFPKKFAVLLIVFTMLCPSIALADTEFETYEFNSEITLFDVRHTVPDDSEVALIEYMASEIGNKTEDIDVKSYNVSKQRFIELLDYLSSNIQLEHPEIFYLDSYSFGAAGNTVTSLEPEYDDSDYINYAQAEIDTELNNITSLLSDDMSDFEKTLTVHDYIINNYEYDTTYQSRSLDTMVMEKQGVCQGYTYLFKYVMDNIGIDCVTVPSDANAHIWNKVKIDGEWYNIDLTSDDPIYDVSYIPYSNSVTRTYFLLNDSELTSFKDDTLHTVWNEYKWDGKTPSEVSDSTAFSDSVIRQLEGPVIYHNGQCYSFANLDGRNGNNNLVTADFSANTLTPVYKDSSSFTWRPWGFDKVYYPNILSTLITMDGELYFNSPNKIYRFNTDDNTAEEVYEYIPDTPDKSQTYIWGLKLFDGILNIEYSKNVYAGVQKYIPVTDIKPLPVPPNVDDNDAPCSSQIEQITENEVKVTFDIPEEVTNVKYVYTAQYDADGVLIGITQTEAGDDECTVTLDDRAAAIRALIMSDIFEPLSNTDPYEL